MLDDDPGEVWQVRLERELVDVWISRGWVPVTGDSSLDSLVYVYGRRDHPRLIARSRLVRKLADVTWGQFKRIDSQSRLGRLAAVGDRLERLLRYH